MNQRTGVLKSVALQGEGSAVSEIACAQSLVGRACKGGAGVVVYGAARRYVRHYVEVIALCRTDGHVMPITIIWDDGRRFDVDVVEDARRARCDHTHGFAIRYAVLIKGRRRYLYHDDQGWFVEVLDAALPGSTWDPRTGALPQ